MKTRESYRAGGRRGRRSPGRMLFGVLFLLTAFFVPAAASAAPVTLRFANAPVADALRAAARLGGFGIVLDGDIGGTVTIDTSEEPSLFIEQLARMYGLSVERQGNTYLVSSAGHRALTERTYVVPIQYGNLQKIKEIVNLSLLKAGKKAQMENKNSKTGKSKSSDRSRQPAEGRGQERASSSEEKVVADPVTQSLIFRGTEQEAQMVREVLAEVDVPAQQVALEAKVAALSKEASKALGVEWTWSSLPQTPEVRENWRSHRTTYVDEEGKTHTVYEELPDREITRHYGGGSVPGVIRFGRSPEGLPYEWYYAAKLDALVTNGKAKLLSRPNITTLTGREASIEIGGDVPVPTVSVTDSTTTTSITYHKAGIILRYTPFVSADGEITATVHTEVSSPLYVADMHAYRFQNRSADTTVRLRDGETMVIGGLIGSEEARSLSKVPLLGDLPVLGAFFRSVRTSKQDSELMIFLTAHVLKPGEKAMGANGDEKGK